MEVRPFLKTRNNSFNHCLFVFCCCSFAADEALFDEHIWLHNKTGDAHSSFWYITHTTKLKIQLWNQHQIQNSITKETKALIQNLSICICILICKIVLRKISWGKHFLVLRKEIMWDVNLPWGLSTVPQHPEIQVKTVSLTTKLWDFANLNCWESTNIKT